MLIICYNRVTQSKAPNPSRRIQAPHVFPSSTASLRSCARCARSAWLAPRCAAASSPKSWAPRCAVDGWKNGWNLWKNIGKVWESVGKIWKSMGKIWENLGKIWEKYGKLWENDKK